MDVMSPQMIQYFKEGVIPLEAQAQVINIVKDATEKLRTADLDGLKALNIPAALKGARTGSKKPVDMGQVEKERTGGLVNCSWQLAEFLRYHRPHTRISEAEPYLRIVIDNHEGQMEETPAMMLAMAIHKVPGREDEVYQILKDAIENGDGGAGPVTFLPAKAAVARALRRVNRIKESKELEEDVITWIKFHPYGYPPSKIIALVSDDTEPADAPNAILDDPRMKAQLGSQVELPGSGIFGSSVVHFG